MEFSSLAFLLVFLPCIFGLYFIIPNLKARNAILIIFSLLLYSYGEPVYVLLMIASTMLNYVFGRLVVQKSNARSLALGILVLSLRLHPIPR